MPCLRRPLLSLASLAVATLAFAGRAAPVAFAEDDDAPPLEYRIYDVGALVGGNPSFSIDRGPFGALVPEHVNDEDRPLFGHESEDNVKPLGAVTDLIELVKATTAPGSWEQDGFKILGKYGVEYCDRSVSMYEAAGRAVAKWKVA